MPFAAALDVIYALWLDERASDVPRFMARDKLNEFLAEPFDPVEAEEFRRERFGLRAEDLAERQQSEAAWGDG